MLNSVSFEFNVLASCFLLGIICGAIFDLFKAVRFGKTVKTSHLILQDILYYLIISIVIFLFILNVNGAEIRGYMPVSSILAFVLYRCLLSRSVVRLFIWMIKITKYIVKILFFPLKALCETIILPFLKIKQKLLSKKAKIALTIKRFCFKIRCNVGKNCTCNKICKERKPCRRKQKPEKRV